MTDNLPTLLPPGSELVPLDGTPRKRGGQRGNRNALKHGFYSHTFSRKEIQRLDADIQGEFRDEEEYLRVLIARTAESVKNEKLTYKEYESLLRAVSLASKTIISIHHSRKGLYDKQTTLDKIWEELKYLPVEED